MSSGGAERDRLSIFMRAVFWIALATVLVLSSMPNPPNMPPNTDKIQHALAFLGLGLLGGLAYPRLPLFRLALALAAFGALIEFVQAIPALHRNTELLDWIADIGGIAVALALLATWRRLKR